MVSSYSDIRYKTCRTANGADVNFEEVYRKNIKCVINTGKMVCETLLSAVQKDGRGNICPVTVIMPTLAMQAKEKVAEIAESEDKNDRQR